MVNASDYAIIVGINRYQKFRELKGPENDGSSFKQWLVSTAGGDVPPANITEIYSNQFGGAAQGPFCSHIDIAFSNLFEKEDAGKSGVGCMFILQDTALGRATMSRRCLQQMPQTKCWAVTFREDSMQMRSKRAVCLMSWSCLWIAAETSCSRR